MTDKPTDRDAPPKASSKPGDVQPDGRQGQSPYPDPPSLDELARRAGKGATKILIAGGT
ncbi:MAG: hypothetical protein NVS2B11_05470 [Acetobacteraceae bacterium]